MTNVKKKGVSKRNKIAWRKHVDIRDVEEFLEDKRLEERLGEQLDKLPNKDLFQVDTLPEDRTRLSSKQRKRLAVQAFPRCFSLLQPLTKTPDPLVKRNRVRSKEERKHPIARRNEQKQLQQGIIKAKEKVRILNREHERNRKLTSKYTPGQVDKDIWQVEDVSNAVISGVEDEQWLTADTIRHTCAGLGKLRKRVPDRYRRGPSILPAVATPHPGTSYNPTLGDHCRLLTEVARDELKHIHEQKHLERVTTHMFARVTPRDKESAWLNEMSEGLSVTETFNESGKPEQGSEYSTVNPPVKNMKKDAKQRRKQKEQKQLEKERRSARVEKKKLSDVYRLRRLEQQIAAKERASAARAERRALVRKQRSIEPLQLSRHEVPVARPEFQLPEEMSGSLRALRSLGNPLRDRYHSLQRRNVLAATAPPQLSRPRAKLKKYERTSHKMGWESKGY